jgi:hypothetical protein
MTHFVSVLLKAALEGEQFDVHPKQLTEDVVAELEQLSLKVCCLVELMMICRQLRAGAIIL